MPRGGVRPSPPELGNMVPRWGPTLPLGIAERWHRNLPSLAKERNPDTIVNLLAIITSAVARLYLKYIPAWYLNLVL
jgi:hypothetical protein